ncbi:hypothetical protein BASA60_000636 [Batrachochytrium salamandrivorans]|nr:hypothetical protein BASA60_000636 [Batrachochytrium salamandrivorans]
MRARATARLEQAIAQVPDLHSPLTLLGRGRNWLTMFWKDKNEIKARSGARPTWSRRKDSKLAAGTPLVVSPSMNFYCSFYDCVCSVDFIIGSILSPN